MAKKQSTRRPILFVQKLIRIRKAIARNKNVPVSPVALELNKLIEYHGYNTERLASSFFIRKKSEILSLIPGGNCPSRKSLMNEYLELIEYSNQILNHELLNRVS